MSFLKFKENNELPELTASESMMASKLQNKSNSYSNLHCLDNTFQDEGIKRVSTFSK